MDRSVYSPGAGHRPRVLAGRDDLMRDWHLMLNDVVVDGRLRAEDTVLTGPRGVGKTVAVSAFAEHAASQGFDVVNLQAVAGHSGLVDGLMQRARARIAEGAGAWQRARQAFDSIGALSVSVGGIGAGVSKREREDARPAPDSGTLAQALARVATEVRKDEPRGGLLVTVDELQVASAPDLALLAATLHRLNVDHPQAPVLFAGTGLPFVPEALRKAGVTHPDRLFMLHTIPLTLSQDDARFAVVEPARQAGVTWEPEAALSVVEASNGYPAHLQLFAHAAWTAAAGPDTITVTDVERSLPGVAAQLERRTLGPRWDRISDRQMEFLAALALLGGRAATSSIARTLGRTQRELSWIREELISEGDVYVPRRGELAMAVPLFNRYVLSNYERSRPDAATHLLTLTQMAENAGVDWPRVEERLPPREPPRSLG